MKRNISAIAAIFCCVAMSVAQTNFIATLQHDGNAVPAEIRVNPVKPYFGIGVGRTVPRKRVGVKGELGVMYWGTPRIYNGDNDITSCQEIREVTKVTDKIPVYPMLKITIFGRIF